MTERRYKIVVAMENSVATFKVIYSTHMSKTEAGAAIRRYEAAHARRAAAPYAGDMS